jgi:hypothetical protein
MEKKDGVGQISLWAYNEPVPAWQSQWLKMQNLCSLTFRYCSARSHSSLLFLLTGLNILSDIKTVISTEVKGFAIIQSNHRLLQGYLMYIET